MRITLNELRTLIRSEVRKTLIENAIRDLMPEEIQEIQKINNAILEETFEEIQKIENYADDLKGSKKFKNMSLREWARHFLHMGTIHKGSLFRDRMYRDRDNKSRDLSDEDLIALALVLDPQLLPSLYPQLSPSLDPPASTFSIPKASTFSRPTR